MIKKKIYEIALFLIMLFSLTSCKKTDLSTVPVGTVKEEISEDLILAQIPFQEGWVINQENLNCDMPLNVKNTFTLATEELSELKFTPLVYVSFKEDSDTSSFRILTQVRYSGNEAVSDNVNCRKELLNIMEKESEEIKDNSRLCMLTIVSQNEESYIDSVEEIRLTNNVNSEEAKNVRTQLSESGWVQNINQFPSLIPLEASIAFDNVISKETEIYELLSFIAHYEEEDGITKYAVICYKGVFPEIEMEIMIISVENEIFASNFATIDMI